MEIKKRGQISIFLIIGIIILFTSALILSLRGTEVEYKPQAPEIARVSEELKPVSDFVENCIEQVATTGMTLLGDGGGRIYQEEFNGNFFEQSKSELFYRFPNIDDSTVPYWYTQINGQERVKIPVLYKNFEGDGSIQDQLEFYMKKTVNNCINNYRFLETKGFRVENIDKPKFEITIGRDNIIFTLFMGADFIQGNVKKRITAFQKTMNYNLFEVYNLARAITEFEIDTDFLDNAVLEFIDLYSGAKQKTKLPPMRGGPIVENCYEKTFWIANSVKDKLQDILQYMTLMRISDTRTPPIKIIDPNPVRRAISQGVYDKFNFNITQSPFKFTKVAFEPYQIQDFNINGETTGILYPIESNKVSLLWFAKFCVHDYNFLWNLKVPFLVTLIDNRYEKEFRFEFPLQTVIEHNRPRRATVADDPIPTVTNETSIDLACDQKQWLSGMYEFTVLDNVTRQPIDSAEVKYICGIKDDGCNIGYTDFDGKLKTKMPPCKNGVITVDKDGIYMLEKSLKTVFFDRSENLTFYLKPMQTRTVQLKKVLTKVYGKLEHQKLMSYLDNHLGSISDYDAGNVGPSTAGSFASDIKASASPDTPFTYKANSVGDIGNAAVLIAKAFANICATPFFNFGEADESILANFAYFCKNYQSFKISPTLTTDEDKLTGFPICEFIKEDTMSQGDQVLLTLSKYDTSTGFLPQTMLNFQQGEVVTAKLWPGRYSMSGTMIKKGKHTIKKGAQYEINPEDNSKINIPQEDIEFPTLLVGGVDLNIDIDQSIMQKDSKLVLKYIEFEKPKNLDQLAVRGYSYKECSRVLKDKLKTEITR